MSEINFNEVDLNLLRILCITTFSAFPTQLNQQVTSANLSEIGVMQRLLNSCILVITAENDSIFYPDGYKDIFKNNHRTTIKSISDSNHFELSTSDEVPNIINDWLQGITRR